MKRVLFSLIFCLPVLAHAQSFVNPDTIYQAGDIILQNTNVYYRPFAPPSDSDTRENLSNVSDILRDPNGVGNQWRTYSPIVYSTSSATFIPLSNWAPTYDSMHHRPDTLGQFVVWQRLFTARDKPNHTHSDIIAGSYVTNDTLHTNGHHGEVIISKNEDVDFRASGTIKLENGFHAMPGCFFHAYQEPKFDTAVFSDEFSDTTKFRNQWIIANGNSDNYGTVSDCSFDTDVRLWADADAHDGRALDLMLREDTVDTCSCNQLTYIIDSCGEIVDTLKPKAKNIFSSFIIRSCPFPYAYIAGGKIGPSAYAHAPYGKYEVRDKIPHVLHHTNNWGGTLDGEWDMNETPNATMGRVSPGWAHHFRYGPCTGYFKKEATDTLFISTDAQWSGHHPLGIIINNILYRVTLAPGHTKDTVVADAETHAMGGFPASLVNSTASVSFYYELTLDNTSDKVTWTVTTDGGGKWDVLHAPYKVVSPGDSLFFSKDYQPTSVTLTTQIIGSIHIQKTFTCRWDYILNAILLNPSNGSDSLLSTDLHTNVEAYGYKTSDLYGSGYGYPVPGVVIDKDTLFTDTAGYSATPYKYHTFAMEWLPNEVRFLIDSNVVRRIPDRMTPPGTKYSDWATIGARSPANIRPAEFDIDSYNDANGVSLDPFGAEDSVAYTYEGYNVYKSITYYERKYFESHTHNPGFWDVNGRAAAHHLIDYVKVWDVPKDVLIPNLPH